MFQVLTKAINHSCSPEWLELLVSTIETGCFKPRVGLNFAWLLTMHGSKSRVDFNHSWSWTTALTVREPRSHIRVVTTRKFTHVCAVVTGRYCTSERKSSLRNNITWNIFLKTRNRLLVAWYRILKNHQKLKFCLTATATAWPQSQA